jgi:hypothetical protein
MRQWYDGILECWNYGMLEWWNKGINQKLLQNLFNVFPATQNLLEAVLI